ncbi:S1 family peptidase [Roseivirga pacifica]|uniref:S1 family peptidase n=1 Tax=Roseivirga pacifica TaxID=1267423 RepID=UPI003BAF3FC1
MNSYLSSKQVEVSSVLILCGADQGTGFFIKEDLVLTARHVVADCLDDDAEIIIEKGVYSRDSIIAENLQLDVCMIKVKNLSEGFIPISNSSFSYNQLCSTFGFPYADSGHGTHLEARINKIGVEGQWDFSFTSKEVSEDVSYDGLSGSAVISRGRAIGIVLRQQSSSILAVSIKKISGWLNENGVEPENRQTRNEIPKSLKDQVDTSTPNYTVMETLTDCIEQHDGGWFLCHGSPGCGKTTFVASYEPEDSNIKIIGRYFIKVPQDSQSPVVRTSERSLVSWFEDITGDAIGNPIDNLDKLEDRIKRVPDLLGLVSNHNPDIKYTILIDGLDELVDLKRFLGIFPGELPSNFAIVLSCTSKEILPSFVKGVLRDGRIVEVIPLNIGQCEIYIKEELKDETLSTGFIQEVARKAAGHPLYLQYLLNYIRSQKINEEELEPWLDEMPIIGGEITNYYESIWDDFFSEEGKLWIILLLSQLRSPIDQGSLLKMLPDNYKLGFYSNLAPIGYLLKDLNLMELYHSSFKHFITSKVPSFISLSNDQIARFCSENQGHSYASNHYLHHLTNGSNPDGALEYCGQDWADQCAIKHVNPDLVIQDAKDVLDIALAEKNANEVIRLLLLLQRISFRYDSVFAENARPMAAALIALGEYEAAINYLVRGNTLLIDNQDAIDFLQLFYENEAKIEGDALLNAFNTRYRYFIQEEFASSNGFSLLPFVHKICASTLAVPSLGGQAIEDFEYTFRNLKNFQNVMENHNDEEGFRAIYQTREMGASWHNGLAMRLYDGYVSVKERSENSGAALDNKWARIIALSIIHFQELNRYNVAYIEKTDSYLSSIKDLEWLIDNYGYDEEGTTPEILIKALIQDSKRSDILEPLISRYLENNGDQVSAMRDENGVDLNYQNVHAHYFTGICKGYSIPEDQLSELPTLMSRYRGWEKYYIDLLNETGQLEGVLTRKRLFEETYDHLIGRLNSLLSLTKLELQERSHWERSYLIPEDLLPILYLKLTELYVNFFPEYVNTLFEFLQENSNKQLGLYTEGYRESLSSVIEVIVKHERFDENTAEIITLLENHVLIHVQNRWERTPELIKIIEFYGLIGRKARAKSIFKKMLDTSMGPSWYKEAQLQLLNVTFRLNSDQESSNEYAQRFLALLDYASGEMTFQRYIRYEKERFIGDLISKDMLDKGLEYLKFETIPPPARLIHNAEHLKVDAVALGDGYIPGARNITIQSGVLEILKWSHHLSPIIKVALCSIFTVNDEVFRYADEYARHMAEALNEITNQNTQLEVFEQIIKILDSEGMQDDAARYIGHLASHMNVDQYNGLVQFARDKKGWKLQPQEQNPSSSEDYNGKEGNNFTTFNKLCSDKNSRVSREKKLSEGIEAFKKERVSIWYDNWSSEHKQAKDNVKSMLQNSEDTIEQLSILIREARLESWSVVDELLWFLDDKLSQDQVNQIYKDISGHFELLIRPEECVFEKYDWLKTHADSSSTNIQLINFIIWLLNHPLDWIHEEAFALVVFLSHHIPEDVIPALISESLKEKPAISCFKSSEVLKIISNENPDLIIEVFDVSPHLLENIASIKHLSIFKNYYDIGKQLEISGYKGLATKLNDSLPDKIEGEREVALEEDMLSLIEQELDELNGLQVLDKNFCSEILNLVQASCKPLTWQEVRKSDRYLIRSYHEAQYHHQGRYWEIVNDALNRSIMLRVSKQNIEEIFNIVKPN